MPIWFFIALFGPICNSIANHVDKYLISKYLKGGKVGSLIIFSSIFSAIALPVVICIDANVFSVGFTQALLLSLNGSIVVFCILLYFYALHKDEASFVVPFYQTIPIFGFILGYFFLGETITKIQFLASLIIIAGATVLSFDISFNKIKFKKDVVFLMLGASFLFALYSVFFKYIAVDVGFWPAVFWGLVGKILVGILFFMFIRSYRNQFLSMVRENNIGVLALNSTSETLFIVAEATTQFATLLAPVSLVLLVGAFQPFLVFIIGALLTIFFPNISNESLNKKVLLQKIMGIGLMVIGGYFIY